MRRDLPFGPLQRVLHPVTLPPKGAYWFPLGGSLRMYGPAVHAPTFARTTARTYVNPNTGLMTTAAIDQPCFEVMPGGGVGLRFDPTRTNSLLRSRALSTSPWVVTGITSITQNAVGIDGIANTAWTLEDADAGAAKSINQTITVPNDGNTHCISFFIAQDSVTTRFPAVQAYLSGGTGTINEIVNVSTTTGAIGNAGATPPASGVIYYPQMDKYRVWFTITNNTSGNTSLLITAWPARTTSINGTLVNAVVGTAIFDQFQVELNAVYPSSPIITGASPVQRTADSLTYPNLVAPTNHVVLVDVVPGAGLLTGKPTAFNLVTFNGTGGAGATGRTEAGADYAFDFPGGGGYLATYKAADLSTTGRNRIVQWVRQSGGDILATLAVNGVRKASLAPSGTLGGMDLTTQFGGYSTSYLGGWLANAVILNNPTAADVAALGVDMAGETFSA